MGYTISHMCAYKHALTKVKRCGVHELSFEDVEVYAGAVTAEWSEHRVLCSMRMRRGGCLVTCCLDTVCE